MNRTHNWLGSLRRGKLWFLTIVWSNCWGKDCVLLTVQVICSITSLPSTYRTECRTSFDTVDTVEDEVLPHSAYYVVTFSLKISDRRTRGADNTVIQHVIWLVIFTNKWLPTIPIVKPSIFVSTKEETIQLFSCLEVIFSLTNSYCIRHINSFLDQIQKNIHIYSILCTHQNDK